MPHWLSITLAVACWLFALQQVRMYCIYTRRIYSPTIGPIDGGPTLCAVAIRSVVTFTIYGFLVLLIAWPRVLTYVSIIWLCREIIDALLGWVGKGVYGVTVAIMTDKGRRHYLVSESVAVLIRAVVFALCAFIFGF